MYCVRHKLLKSFLFFGIVFGGGWLSADDFVERKISVSVPQLPAAPGKMTQLSIGELSLFTLRKAVLSPAGGSPIFVAPYYYAAEVTWYNTGGTPKLISGKQVTTTVYLALMYDTSLRTWKDVSGVGFAPDGVTRTWTHSDNYVVCSKSASGVVSLRAFATGGDETSIAYDAVAIGTANVPKPYTISSLDLDVLTLPATFFNTDGSCGRTIIETQANGYAGPQPVIGSYTISNTLAAVSVATATAATVAVTIGTTTYNLPQSMIYQVMNPLTTSIAATPAAGSKTPVAATPLTVEQYWLNTLSHGGISAVSSAGTLPASSPVVTPQPFKACVPTAFDMKLADYYLAVSGATPADTTFIALSLTSPMTATVPAFSAWKNTASGLALSADATSISIQGGAFFDPTLRPSGQMYVDGFAYPVTVDKQESLRSSYLALVGVSDSDPDKQKKIDKDRQDLYQQLQLTYDASGFVIAASAQFFTGQCGFYMRPLNKVTVLARDQVLQNPLNAVALAESAFYALGKGMNAVLEDGIDTSAKNLKKVWADASKVGAMIQVKFLTADAAVSYDGILVTRGGFVANPVPYYRYDMAPLCLQCWYSPSGGVVSQLSADFSGSTITGLAIADDAEVTALSADLKKNFTDKAHDFWGLTPYKEETKAAAGMSTAQKVGQGFAYAGIAAGGALALTAFYKYAQYRQRKADGY
ncbi:MAG: hypothetical protein QG604_750 [Candidatus Dependentiae bacterium]|nr:hypothetical protein [Candidatus Dependentiae bacterium]